MEKIQQTVNTGPGGNNSDGEFTYSSHGFERLAWTDDNEIEVEFGDDHDVDGFGIRYHAKSRIEDDILVAPAPDYGGTKTVDFFGQLTNMDSYPPAGEYNLVAYKGQFNTMIGYADETIGMVSFTINPEVEIRETSLTEDQNISMELENSGNAPAQIRMLSVDDQQVEVDTTLAIDGTGEIVTEDPPFPADDENCIEVPPTTELGFEVVPSIDLGATFDTEYDEVYRECTIPM
jgi:hypothetical protein